MTELRGGLQLLFGVALAAAVLVGMRWWTGPAHALSSRDAAAVVDLIERLKPQFGDFAFDEEIADEWFDEDAAAEGLIVRAGFSRERWKAALGETIRGFIAAIPRAEVEAMLSGAREGIKRLKELDPQQKKEALDAVDEQIRALWAMRLEGALFADTVRPYVPRLRALLTSRGGRAE